MLVRFKIFFKRNLSQSDLTLEELLVKQNNGALVIDVRNKREYEEGHIEGSLNIPEYEIKKDFQKKISKDNVIVLYCSGGERSKKAYKKLKKMGYEEVYNLYGGLDKY